MNRLPFLFTTLFFCGSLCPDLGLAKTNLQAEISHLINFVGNSDCIFIRNGTEHDAKNAAKHIQKKYKHFNTDINSPEKFIELSATKSTLSNKPYFVRCGKKPSITSKKWLLEELNQHRVLNNTNK